MFQPINTATVISVSQFTLHGSIRAGRSAEPQEEGNPDDTTEPDTSTGKRHKILDWYFRAVQQHLQGAQAEAPEGEHRRPTTTSDTLFKLVYRLYPHLYI